MLRSGKMCIIDDAPVQKIQKENALRNVDKKPEMVDKYRFCVYNE